MTMGQYGIVRIGFERPPWGIASGNSDTVIVTGAAFRNHEIIFIVNLVHMRPLRPLTARTAPDFFEFAFKLSGLQIQDTLTDIAVASTHVTDIINCAVIVEK